MTYLNDLIALLCLATKIPEQGNSERFWRAVVSYAQAKVKRKYVNRAKFDCCCERCLTWASEVDGVASVKDSTAVSYVTICKKCGHETYWDIRSGMVSTQIKTLPDMKDRKDETARIVYNHLYESENGS